MELVGVSVHDIEPNVAARVSALGVSAARAARAIDDFGRAMERSRRLDHVRARRTPVAP